MVDVRINDRKGDDGRLVNLSRAAADYLGLAPNRVASGSLMVVNGNNPGTTSSFRPSTSPAPAPANTGGSQSIRPVRPLASLFGGAAAGGAVASGRSNSAAIPAADYNYPDPGTFTNGASIPPAPRYSGGATASTAPPMVQTKYGDYQGNVAAPPRATSVPPAPVKPVSVSAAAPYRVQFGAFQNPSAAHDLAASIGRAGIGAMVAQAPGSNLYVVLTGGGFRSTADANRWIDQESAQRGWRERPVVVR